MSDTLTLERCASEVHPGLWISAMPGPAWPIDQWGVDLLVTLSEHLPPQAARRFQWGTSGGAVGEGRIVFSHYPFPDGDVPDERLLHYVAQQVTTAIDSGLTVLTHCQEGRNRSGLLAALAIRNLLGVDGAHALEVVRASRAGMLSNRAFANYVSALPQPPSH